jgi:spheroidene monooxygenase
MIAPVRLIAPDFDTDGKPAEPFAPRQVSQDANQGTRVAAHAVGLVVLADIAPRARLWGWTAFLLSRFPLRSVRGLRFAKVMGSGRDGGFGLVPSLSRQGMFLAFDDDAAIDAFLDSHPLQRAFQDHSREWACVRLRALSSRGSWSGQQPFAAAPGTLQPPPGVPVAALTRASIRLSRAIAFWRHAPPSEVSLATADGCLLAAGLGEAPLLRQATFSLWRDVDAMNAYARRGAHQAAITASREHGFFSESMFVRFAPYAARGRWHERALEPLCPARP